MKNIVCLCLVAAVIFTGSCAAAVELIVSDDVMVRSDETIVLTCRLKTVDYQLCQWQMGSINFYSVTNPPSDIQWVDKDNARDCSIRFNKINDNFNGKWTCTVVPNVANNNPIEKSIKVTVGKLPTEVSFEPPTRKLIWRAGQETTITCKAPGSRPATVLHWYFVDGDQKTEISSKSINVTNKENVDASTFDTTSVLAYTFLPEHNGLILRCDPEHFAYLPNTTTKPTPEMSLNITFAPVHGSDPNLGTFYGYSIDEVGIITVNFSSNPPPFNNATWIVQDGTRVPVPSPSTDDPYSSSDIEVVDVAKGLFTVTLTINKVTVADTEGKHYLRVYNGMSTTEFSFRLSASAAPPPPTGGQTTSSPVGTVSERARKNGEGDADGDDVAAGVGAGVIVGIIVIILVVLVLVGLIFFARSRGMLCFSAPPAADENKDTDPESGDAADRPDGEKPQARSLSARLSAVYTQIVKPKKDKQPLTDVELAETKEETKELTKPDDPDDDVKEGEEEPKKPGEIVYAELDLQKDSSQPVRKADDDKTEYAEIVGTLPEEDKK